MASTMREQPCEQILIIARELFAKYGYAAVSMEHIAQQAGVATMVTDAFLIEVLRSDEPRTAAYSVANLLLYGVCDGAYASETASLS